MTVTASGVLLKLEVGISKRAWQRAWRYPAYLWSLRWVYAVKKTPEVGIRRIAAYTPQYTTGDSWHLHTTYCSATGPITLAAMWHTLWKSKRCILNTQWNQYNYIWTNKKGPLRSKGLKDWIGYYIIHKKVTKSFIRNLVGYTKMPRHWLFLYI